MTLKKVTLLVGALALSISMFGGAIEAEAAPKKNFGTESYVLDQYEHQLGKKGSKVNFVFEAEGSTLKSKRPHYANYERYIEVDNLGIFKSAIDVKLYNKTTKKFEKVVRGKTNYFVINPDQNYELRIVETDNKPSKVKVKTGYNLKKI